MIAFTGLTLHRFSRPVKWFEGVGDVLKMLSVIF
jgi:hypothetical protein